ncbi:50S ribosomal protein L25 [Glycine max]|nr:50S ribosomal protein L25 [Glycine max]
MYLPRHHILTRLSPYRRHFSHSAAAVLRPPGPEPLTYLDGFPRPDPKHDETILAIPRADSGKNISAKERRAGRLPSIVFEQEDGQHGGNKRLISVRTDQIRKLVNHLGRSFFLSRLFHLQVRAHFDSEDDFVETVRVLPRAVRSFSLVIFLYYIVELLKILSLISQIHLKAGTDAPLNVTFIRAPSNALLKVDVPLVFRGEDVSPGLKKGASLNTIKRTVKYLCPADIIPPYIDVDLSELDVGQKLVMGDLKVHPALKLLQSRDEAVVKIMGQRVSELQKKK